MKGISKRVLYLCAGNPIEPASGMDVVVSQHLQELLRSDQLTIVAVATALGRSHPTNGEDPRLSLFFAGEPGSASLSRKLSFVFQGKPLMTYGFYSESASDHIRRELKRDFDLIIIDHFQALANVTVLQLLLNRRKMVFIDHDVTIKTILHQPGTLGLRRLLHLALSLQVAIIESVLIARSTTTFFLSDKDKLFWRWMPKRLETLLPLISVKPSLDDAPTTRRSILFVGSPTFPPNLFAIEWISKVFAPILIKTCPELSLELVGKGTERIKFGSSNVRGLGFVDDSRLKSAFDRSLFAISPVVHGSGVKIKLLEALASGCPVVATRESLAGLSAFTSPVVMDLGSPTVVADYAKALWANEELQENARSSVRLEWSLHVAKRDGALRAAIEESLKKQT